LRIGQQPFGGRQRRVRCAFSPQAPSIHRRTSEHVQTAPDARLSLFTSASSSSSVELPTLPSPCAGDNLRQPRAPPLRLTNTQITPNGTVVGAGSAIKLRLLGNCPSHRARLKFCFEQVPTPACFYPGSGSGAPWISIVASADSFPFNAAGWPRCALFFTCSSIQLRSSIFRPATTTEHARAQTFFVHFPGAAMPDRSAAVS